MILTRDITSKGRDELTTVRWILIPAVACLPWLWWSRGGPAVWMVLLAAVMASFDLATHRIPNFLTAAAAAGGLAWGAAAQGLDGGFSALLGGLTGFGLMAVFFFLGAVGGGDVKAVGALSTFLSPLQAVHLFVLIALAGGALALGRLAAARGSPGLGLGLGSLSLPYGLAIFGGVVALVCTGGV